jgi:hypothetical protein
MTATTAMMKTVMKAIVKTVMKAIVKTVMKAIVKTTVTALASLIHIVLALSVMRNHLPGLEISNVQFLELLLKIIHF